MALLTPHEFCTLIGIKYNNLSTYFNPPRSKFVYTQKEGKRYVDTDLPINAVFVKERQKKMEKEGKEVPRVEKKAGGVKVPAVDGGGGTTAAAIDKNAETEKIFKVKTGFEEKKLEKITQETAILQLKKAKLAGEVVPVGLVQPVVFQFMAEVHSQQKIADEAVLSEIAHKYQMTAEDIGIYRAMFINKRNAAIVEARDLLVHNLENIINLFGNKKDVGERT